MAAFGGKGDSVGHNFLRNQLSDRSLGYFLADKVWSLLKCSSNQRSYTLTFKNTVALLWECIRLHLMTGV